MGAYLWDVECNGVRLAYVGVGGVYGLSQAAVGDIAGSVIYIV